MPEPRLNGWARLLVEVAVMCFAVGVGWMALAAKVENKADRSTVEAMAADVRLIKGLICQDHPGDSACLPSARREQ